MGELPKPSEIVTDKAELKKKPSDWEGLWGCAVMISIIFAIIAVYSLVNGETALDQGGSTSTTATAVDAPVGTACGANGRVTQVDFAVASEAPLQTRADKGAAQFSMSFGVDQQVQPVAIDPTMPVREICRAGSWSEIRVLQLPSDIGKAQGWVPTSMLRTVTTNKNGRRIYEETDFEWPDGSGHYRKAVLSVLNRILAHNPRCDAFNSQSLLIDSDRTGPTFKIACFGAKEQVVEFRPGDAANGRSFAPVNPIALSGALPACQQAARNRATHPSTVSFSILNAHFQPYDDGRATFETTFTAKNSFDLELTHTVRCSFNGSELVKVEIAEGG